MTTLSRALSAGVGPLMPAVPANAAAPPPAPRPQGFAPSIVPADPDATHVYRFDEDAIGNEPALHLTVIVTRTAPDLAIATLAPDDGRPGALATDLALVPAATSTPEPRPSDEGGGRRGGFGGGRRGPGSAERRALATLPAPFAAVAAELATNAGPGISRDWTTDRTIGSGDAAATVHLAITVHGGTFTAAHGTITRGRSSGGWTMKAL